MSLFEGTVDRAVRADRFGSPADLDSSKNYTAVAGLAAPPPAPDQKIKTVTVDPNSFSIAAAVVRASASPDTAGEYPRPPTAESYCETWRRWESSARHLPWNGVKVQGLKEAHLNDCVDLLCLGLHSLAKKANWESNAALARKLDVPQIGTQILQADANAAAELTVAIVHGIKQLGNKDRDIIERLRSTAMATLNVLAQEGRIQEAIVLRSALREAYDILRSSNGKRVAGEAPIAVLDGVGASEFGWPSSPQFVVERELVMAAVRRGRPLASIELAVGRFGVGLALRGNSAVVVEALKEGLNRIKIPGQTTPSTTELEYTRTLADVTARAPR